ncbi:MAG: hypothetical protein K0S33_1975 [Bacteroidetes bacterium]|jgi:hypothetical protein|nr:hypothetical protein [Bacteroidota bacterium]
MIPHIGKKIKEELYKQQVSVGAFAKKINRSRQVVYNIFERESIDTELLSKISEVLKFDFFSMYDQQKHQTAEEKNNKLKEETAILEQKIKWLEVEIQYLKKLNALLESQHEILKSKPSRKKV